MSLGPTPLKAAARPAALSIGGNVTLERFEGERTLMRIHIGESDKWHGKPLYEAIVELLRKESFSGVTVLRGVAVTAAPAFITPIKFFGFRRTCPSFLKL